MTATRSHNVNTTTTTKDAVAAFRPVARWQFLEGHLSARWGVRTKDSALAA